jgi:hypothetical protein
MTWRKREIMDMARECNLVGMRPHLDGIYFEALEAFAKLVREDEREKFLGALRQLHDSYSLASDPTSIRARGQE